MMLLVFGLVQIYAQELVAEPSVNDFAVCKKILLLLEKEMCIASKVVR